MMMIGEASVELNAVAMMMTALPQAASNVVERSSSVKKTSSVMKSLGVSGAAANHVPLER
jgi:hypothetical protein